ncbi:hypothetical protein PFNF54_00743, partial [Plasmodium falciparum NF54]
MAPGSTGTQDDDAKNMFDRIGQQVYDEIMKKDDADAKKYIKELKGKLSFASILGESAGTDDPCQLESKYTELISGSGSGVAARGHPCGNVSGKGEDVSRFSKERVSKYDEKKIGCSNSEGACAPYRRLSLCNKNFQKINNYSSKAKHNLLLDVCLAANHEGQSIKTHLKQYDAEYPSGSGHTTCTALARSFADIGDIIRGKDLYRRDKGEKKKLEEHLKTIFGKIHSDVTSSGSNKEALQERYNGDKENYYKLREDWWTANRETVWEAITCDDDDKLANASYFRATCSDSDGKGSFSQANDKCRCKDKKGKNTDQVPTYFDYVPQYLRWFEEWAEDFCRKKKKYVNIVKTYCRKKDNSSEERYCSRNGFDCEKTKRAIGKLRYGKGCTDCFFACYPYEKWIDNKKKEFLKQKEKYINVINGTSSSSRKTRAARGSNVNGYEKIFYEKLKEGNVGNLDAFLGLLNNEKACQDIKDDKEGGKINFKDDHGDINNNNKDEGTFYRSKYCQPCPYCGVKKNNNGGSGGGNKWEEKHESDKCTRIKLYKPRSGQGGTPIKILKSGEGEKEIKEKIDDFCTKTQNGTGDSNIDSSLCDPWKCYEIDELTKEGQEGEDDVDDRYYDELVETGGGLCILKKEKKEQEKEKSDAKSQNDPDEIQKTFYDFFYYWVAHMLKDSIYWRTKKLDKCLQNGNKKCGKKICNGDCECFQRWVEKKKTEWTNIKDHFVKQKGIPEGCYFTTLEGVLQIEFLNEGSAQDKQNSLDAKEIQHLKQIKKILDEEKQKNQEETAGGCGPGVASDNKKETIMDKLIDYEKKIATECIEKHKCPDPPREGAGRSDTSRDSPSSRPAQEVGDSEEDEDEDEDDEEEHPDDGKGDANEEEAENHSNDQEDKDTLDAVVENTEVGPSGPATPVDDKVCDIVSKLFSGNDFGDACGTKYDKYGREKFPNWKCIPSGDKTAPSSDSNQGSICVPPRRRRLYVGGLTKWASGNTVVSGQAQTPQGDTTSPSDNKLRDAFIQSAAIETFFLWHKYKMDKEIEKKQQQKNGLVANTSNVGKEHQEKLEQSGIIPEDFKRQMFYTLGDYRDILFGKDISGDKNMDTIEEKINGILPKNGTPSPAKKNTPTEWWSQNGEHIWNAMICALTYDTNTASGDKPTQNEKVKEALWDEQNNKPKNDYQYSSVTIGGEGAEGQLQSTDSKDAARGEKTPLDSFIKRPPYFRYLEEWGQNFCKERKKRLKDIKYECRGDENITRYGSGYGEDCKNNLPENPSTFKDLEYPTCAKYCRFYKKWINTKKTEYEKQEKIYVQQKKDATSDNGNKYDSNCDGKLKQYASIESFLEKLVQCKKDNGEGTIKFNGGQTFQHTEDCKSCSKFRIKCDNDKCSGGNTKVKCDGKTPIDAKEIANMINSPQEVTMLVSDNGATGFKGDDLKEACEGKGIFEGIRKEQWKCDNVCGYVVCKPKEGNRETVRGEKNDDKHIITIRAL